MIKKSWKKGIAVVTGVIVLIIVAVAGMYFLDQDVNVGEYKGVVSGFDPLAEAGGENIAEEKGIIPAHALGITNIMADRLLRSEEFSEYTDYFIRDVREGGYYIVAKGIPGGVMMSGKTPECVIDNQTGAIVQMGIQSGM